MENVMKKRFKLMKNQKGMTLLELMAVVVILGILAAVAGAAVMNSFNTARTGSDEASIRIIEDAAERYLLANPTDTTITLNELVSGGFLKEAPTPAQGGTFTITVTGTNITVTRTP